MKEQQGGPLASGADQDLLSTDSEAVHFGKRGVQKTSLRARSSPKTWAGGAPERPSARAISG